MNSSLAATKERFPIAWAVDSIETGVIKVYPYSEAFGAVLVLVPGKEEETVSYLREDVLVSEEAAIKRWSEKIEAEILTIGERFKTLQMLREKASSLGGFDMKTKQKNKPVQLIKKEPKTTMEERASYIQEEADTICPTDYKGRRKLTGAFVEFAVGMANLGVTSHKVVVNAFNERHKNKRGAVNVPIYEEAKTRKKAAPIELQEDGTYLIRPSSVSRRRIVVKDANGIHDQIGKIESQIEYLQALKNQCEGLTFP